MHCVVKPRIDEVHTVWLFDKSSCMGLSSRNWAYDGSASGAHRADADASLLGLLLRSSYFVNSTVVYVTSLVSHCMFAVTNPGGAVSSDDRVTCRGWKAHYGTETGVTRPCVPCSSLAPLSSGRGGHLKRTVLLPRQRRC